MSCYLLSFKPSPSAHHHCSAESPTTSNAVTINLLACPIFCNVLRFSHFITNGIILYIPQEVLVQKGNDIKHVRFVKKVDLGQNYLPPPFLLLFLAVHLVSPAHFATLQPNSFALR